MWYLGSSCLCASAVPILLFWTHFPVSWWCASIYIYMGFAICWAPIVTSVVGDPWRVTSVYWGRHYWTPTPNISLCSNSASTKLPSLNSLMSNLKEEVLTSCFAPRWRQLTGVIYQVTAICFMRPRYTLDLSRYWSLYSDGHSFDFLPLLSFMGQYTSKHPVQRCGPYYAWLSPQ